MQAVTLPRVVAALAAVVVAGLVLRHRAPPVEFPVASLETEAQPLEAEPAADTGASLAAAETPAAAKLRELRALSETFRNTTFLIEIRDHGFVCKELLGVYGGVNNSMTWTASCSEMLAYTVTVASAGTLHVEPLLERLDAVPRVVPQPSERELVLPPERR
jgi:hypothetical protein